MEENNSSQEEIKYAGFGIRLLAVIIDGFVTSPIGILIVYNFLVIKSFPLMILTTILSALYKPLMEWRYGATVGKMTLKLKVIDEFNNYLRLDQAFGRNGLRVRCHARSCRQFKQARRHMAAQVAVSDDTGEPVALIEDARTAEIFF